MKISNTQESKIHNSWYSIKNYLYAKKKTIHKKVKI